MQQLLLKFVKYKKKMAITLTAAAPEAQYFFEIFLSLSPARYLPFLSVTPCSAGSNIDPDISTRSFILQF